MHTDLLMWFSPIAMLLLGDFLGSEEEIGWTVCYYTSVVYKVDAKHEETSPNSPYIVVVGSRTETW